MFVKYVLPQEIAKSLSYQTNVTGKLWPETLIFSVKHDLKVTKINDFSCFCAVSVLKVS